MKRSPAAIAAICLIVPLLLAPIGPAGAARAGEGGRPPDPARTTSQLLASGDRAAREGKLVEALEDWRLAYERKFAGFRAVAFRYHVRPEYLDRAGLREKLVEDFRKEMPDEKLAAEQKALAAFGFVRRDLDLKDTYLRLLTEQVAGFYDPDTKNLYLIREAQAPEKRSWWQKISGSGGVDPGEQKMVLVHEMSHALMDQYHDLLSLQRSAEDDDDMSLAIGGLVEGEATASMIVDGQPDLFRLPPNFMKSYFDMITPFLGLFGGSEYRRAPPVLRETLLFPYSEGLVFCLTLASRRGDWGPIDDAFSRPPLSSEQILHPDKYPADVPLAVSFPDVAAHLGAGWSLVTSNVLGEFHIRLLLASRLPAAESAKAAAGWGGDFYRVYERKGGAAAPAAGDLAVVWATVWDSGPDADEFRASFSRFLAKDRKPEAAGGGPDALDSGVVPAGPERVVVLLRVPRSALDAVGEKAKGMLVSPKTLLRKQVKSAVAFPEDARIRSRKL